MNAIFLSGINTPVLDTIKNNTNANKKPINEQIIERKMYSKTIIVEIFLFVPPNEERILNSLVLSDMEIIIDMLIDEIIRIAVIIINEK